MEGERREFTFTIRPTPSTLTIEATQEERSHNNP
jgi:hypothetical protein